MQALLPRDPAPAAQDQVPAPAQDRGRGPVVLAQDRVRADRTAAATRRQQLPIPISAQPAARRRVFTGSPLRRMALQPRFPDRLLLVRVATLSPIRHSSSAATRRTSPPIPAPMTALCSSRPVPMLY